MVTRPSTRGVPRRARRRAPARTGRASAYLLFIPSAALLALALWQRGRSPVAPAPSNAPSAPERVAQDGEIPGWDGALELEEGVILSARLERLHPVRERQLFDVGALRERFPDTAAAGGEPWRLVLTAASSGGPVGAVAVRTLAGLRVGDLRALASGDGTAAAPGPTHPLTTLLTPPAGALRAGETVSLVLWGEAPDGPVAVGLPGVEAELLLVPSVREGSAATSAVAAIDARVGAAPGGEEQR